MAVYCLSCDVRGLLMRTGAKMREDLPTARLLFERSLEQSKKIGLREGLFEAKQALRRLDRLQSAANHCPVSPLRDGDAKPKTP